MAIIRCIYLTLLVANTEGERSFSALKRVKNYLRLSLTQNHVCDFCIMAIEKSFTKSISFEDIIDKFAAAKCRKYQLPWLFLCCTLCVVYYIFCVVYFCPANETVRKFYSIFNLSK